MKDMLTDSSYSDLNVLIDRYKRAQSLGKVGNWEYNLVSREFWGSDEAKRIYGFDPESEHFSVDTVEGCIPEREKVHQALIDLIEKNQPYDLEFEILTYDAQVRKTIISVAEIEQDERGNPIKVVGVIQDISRRKRIEQELKNTTKRLKNAQKLARVGYWDWTIESNRLSWSSDVYEIFGQSPVEFEVTVEAFEAQIHPEDFDSFMQERERALEEERDVDIEHRIIRPNGSIRWVHEIAEIIRDEQGKVREVNGVVIDISEQKAQQEELARTLRQKEFLLRELNHRIKNNLMLISSLIMLKHEQREDNDILDLKNQVDAIQGVYQSLHEAGSSEGIDLRRYFERLLPAIFSFSTEDISLEMEIDADPIPPDLAVPVGLIVNEHATNAVKHGFTPQKPCTYLLRLHEQKPQRSYTLTLANTGMPFPADTDVLNAQSFGLSLIRSLVQQVGGTLTFQREPYPLFKISIPYSP